MVGKFVFKKQWIAECFYESKDAIKEGLQGLIKFAFNFLRFP